MTICIGFIPNAQTAMLMQDSEITYATLGFTQDITHKIQTINSDSIAGVIGDPTLANEVLARVKTTTYNTSQDLRKAVELTYHEVREEKLRNGFLKAYGFNNIREVTNPERPIDPIARDKILKAIESSEGFGLDLMLATVLDQPQLYTVRYPGVGRLETGNKMYAVSGSGSIMAIDKMGEELLAKRWQRELTTEEAIEILMRAGKASEKHHGVGGPFEIAIVSNQGKQDERINRPDIKMINMVMYLFPLNVRPEIMAGCVERLRDPTVNSVQLADYIRENIKVGIEFDKYFGLE